MKLGLPQEAFSQAPSRATLWLASPVALERLFVSVSFWTMSVSKAGALSVRACVPGDRRGALACRHCRACPLTVLLGLPTLVAGLPNLGKAGS